MSDFLGPDCSRALAIANQRHDCVAVTMGDPRESSLPDVGFLTLRDAETDELLELDTRHPRVRALFAKAAQEREQRLARLAPPGQRRPPRDPHRSALCDEPAAFLPHAGAATMTNTPPAKLIQRVPHRGVASLPALDSARRLRPRESPERSVVGGRARRTSLGDFKDPLPTMRNSYLFTSESVSEGHPDKVADQISDAIVDLFLSKDPEARIACETMTTTNSVVLAGEIRGKGIMDRDGNWAPGVPRGNREDRPRDGQAHRLRAVGLPLEDLPLREQPPPAVRAHRAGRRRRAATRTKARATRASCSASPATRLRT